jgi:hypothetical protein
MMRDIRTFLTGAFGLHPIWQVWLLLMAIVNGVVPLFFLPDLAAIVTLVGVFSGAILGLLLVRLQGFTKLLGLMHVPWIPMLATQIGLYPGFDSASYYSMWLTSAIVITTISLVIDVIDVVIFFRARDD